MGDETLGTIAVLGGTGKEGSGLALRWAHKGHRVILGSRSAEKANESAAAMNQITERFTPAAGRPGPQKAK